LISGISDPKGGDTELSLLCSVTGKVESPVLIGEREDEAVAAIITGGGVEVKVVRSREVGTWASGK
jgi:hypothetical protein